MVAFKEVDRLGYKRIGFLTEPASKKWYLFEAGFLMAQQRVNVRNRLPIFRIPEQPSSASQGQFERWLKRERPDAIISTIPSAGQALKQAGYRIPGDIALAAMSVVDGNADAGIYQNSEEIGRAAVLLLISMIQDNDRGIPALHREILVPGGWVDGGSMPGRR